MDSNYSLNKSYGENLNYLDSFFRIDKNFDIVGREIKIGSRSAKMYFIDGFAKDAILEKIMEFLMSLNDEDIDRHKSTREFANSFLPYIEVDLHYDIEVFSTYIFSGGLGLIVDGFDGGLIIDTRTYPVRGMSEPENDKVLRGSHEGFVETLIFNTALIRRKIRDRNLTMDIHTVGEKSKTDIVLCYLDNKADPKILKKLKNKIDSIDINSLSMSQESLAECLVTKQHLNPFPKVRYTERPDTAAACVNEGNIIILVDGSPAAMIVPTSFMTFLQDTNDFYFPPIVGTYLRFIRSIIFGLAMLLTPLWYIFTMNPDFAPGWFSVFNLKEPYTVPIIAQLLIIEMVIDALKLASLNTPNSLSNSLSIIGALVLGDLAVSAGLFSSEVVLLMSFVAIANFAQPSLELGYAFKLSRIFILILSAVFNIPGFFIGLGIVILTISLTETVSGKCYLYPIVPFNKKAFMSLIIRKPISKNNT